MYVIVVGCGRVGAELAQLLTRRDHDVTVIDQVGSSFSHLDPAWRGRTIEAEAMAAAGDPDRAARLAERVVSTIGVDEAWKLRGGVATRITWPAPTSFRSPARKTEGAGNLSDTPALPTPERTAAAHTRLESARRAFAAGELDDGDRQLAAALRLDARIGPEGAVILEATLGTEAPAERLLLYGDLLRAAGREADATVAFDRAARA